MFSAYSGPVPVDCTSVVATVLQRRLIKVYEPYKSGPIIDGFLVLILYALTTMPWQKLCDKMDLFPELEVDGSKVIV